MSLMMVQTGTLDLWSLRHVFTDINLNKYLTRLLVRFMLSFAKELVKESILVQKTVQGGFRISQTCLKDKIKRL